MSTEARRPPGTLRRRLARWLDPSTPTAPPIPPHAPAAAPTQGPAAPAPHRVEPARVEPAADIWPAMCEQFALRILSAVYQAGGQLEVLEGGEEDAGRLGRLYGVDHGLTRVRRQAENMQVLAGRQVEDAGRRVTSLVDVVRAAVSAVEQYSRVRVGRVVGLAVVEFGADDVMRVLTELVDNAVRFSPPDSVVVVSGHLTEQGSVLIRIEDNGVGIEPHALAAMNAHLAGHGPAIPGGSTAQLGLAVVARLATTHRLRVNLIARQPGGTTAVVLLPEPLLCEIPESADDRQPTPTPNGRGTHLVPVQAGGGAPAPTPAQREDLPRRTPASLRDAAAPAPSLGAPPQPAGDHLPWYDDVAAFAAGVDGPQGGQQ